MRQFHFFVVFTLLTVLLAVSSASAQASPLEGEWIATTPETRGLTRVIISSVGNVTRIEAWGRCHPRDCRWGTTAVAAVGNSVEDRTFDSGFAIWNAGFANKYMTLTIEDGSLRIEMTTIFCDRSGRANFRSIETMRRVEY